MAKEEQETIINFNRADMEDGFFTFGTSVKSDYERLARLVGKEKLKTKVCVMEGKESYWSCRVPVEYARMRCFGVKSRALVGLKSKEKAEGKVRGRPFQVKR